MDRRGFFKLVGTASGGIVTGACGHRAREIVPLLVPEREIVPGVEEWHPSVCRECGAGCGIIVRVMEAERQVQRDSSTVRERIAAIKKIEGNPLDPVSGGRLCARGQAGVQSLYHPDRVRGPLKRTGARGAAQFSPVAWEAALGEASALLGKADPTRIVFVARSAAGSRSATIAAFLKALGAPAALSTGVGDFTIEREAAARAYGRNGLPVYDIQDADIVLGIGADFLGGWVSPVFYSRRFGHMRQGRTGRRGRLVQAESRFSITAGAADEWLPVAPGGEHAFALAMGQALVTEKLARGDAATAGLRDAFASVDFDRAAQICGLPVARIRRVARELGSAERAVVLAGASTPHTGSLDAVIAGNALNWLLGSAGAHGRGVFEESRPRSGDLLARLESAQVVLIDGADPAYTLPASAALLAKAPAVISLSPFIDDSAAYADLVLPDHSWLESAGVIEAAASPGVALAGARPFVRPLHDTRAAEETLAEIGKRLNKQIDATPRVYERVFSGLKPAGDWADAADFAAYCERQGGWWSETAPGARAVPKPPDSLPPLAAIEFHGDPQRFPLRFLPYPTPQFGDGSGANLPWMQELPDAVSSAMWGLPVELDAATARQLGVANGDIVRVISPRGQIEAWAYVNPAAIPGVVAMGIGGGHAHYTRYGSRGANPLAIVEPALANGTGVFAFAATRVRIEKAGRRGGFVQFAPVDREPEISRS